MQRAPIFSVRTARAVAAPAAALPAGLRNAIIALGLASLAAALAGAVWGMRQGEDAPVLAAGDITGSTGPAHQVGASGLPLPRFVTLKAGKVNVRKGPSHEHGIAWVFQRKGLPVEITAESDNWRKIRDSDGAEGWIQQTMLAGKRNVLVAAWAKDKGVLLRDEPRRTSAIVVKLAAGVVGTVESCDGDWCYVQASDYEGYAKQDELWGVYPGEKVD